MPQCNKQVVWGLHSRRISGRLHILTSSCSQKSSGSISWTFQGRVPITEKKKLCNIVCYLEGISVVKNRCIYLFIFSHTALMVKNKIQFSPLT